MATLCLLSLLTVLCLSVMHAARRHGQLARASFDTIRQRELADSALRLAIIELSAPPPRTASISVGGRTFDVFGESASVTVMFEAGRIDLNYADEFLLAAAFGGNGFDEQEAHDLAAKIIDWRDVDDTRRDGGAERDDYRDAGRTSGPRNGPFETVSELKQVLGTDEITDPLLEAFTVYSHSPTVRQDVAEEIVVNALRWAQGKQLAGRTWLSPEASSGKQYPSLAGEVLRMEACTQARMEVCRTAVVRFTGNRHDPALVFQWR